MICCLLTGLLSACTPEATPPAEPRAPYVAPSGALLAAPVAEGQEARNDTFRVLQDLIARTPAGERIRIVGSSFSYVPAAQALVAAHERGGGGGAGAAVRRRQPRLEGPRGAARRPRRGPRERGVGLARLMAEKAARGADVEVVLGPSVGPRVRAVLSGSRVAVHPGVFDNGDDVHHKLVVVSAPGRSHDFVLTGSDNWTERSLGRPELLLRLDARPAVARYDRWVDRIVGRGERERT